MITIPNQAIIFDNCIKDVCKCGGLKCDKLALLTDNFSFQFKNINNQFGVGVEPTIDIIELCDNTVIDQIDAGDYFINEQVVRGLGIWSNYITADGCYYLRLNDVDYIVDGSFATDLDEWDFNVGMWVWEGIGARTTDNNETISQQIDGLTCLNNAVIRYRAEAIGQATLHVLINGNQVAQHTLTDQDLTFAYFLADSLPDHGIDIQTVNSVGFYVTGLVAGERMYIKNVKLENDYASNPICIYEEIHECTKYFEAYSDVNHTDFEFVASGFRHYLRVAADISDPFYPCEEEIYLSSAGANTLQYSRHEKHYKLSFGRLMESTWDAISSIMMCQNLYIDDERWTKIEGNIEPKFGKINKRLAVGGLTIKKQTENRKL